MPDLKSNPSAAQLFAGPGDVRALGRSLDWSATPIGRVETWPPSLRAAVRLCLASPTKMAVWAGPKFVFIYNQAYASILGSRHPWAFGRTSREVGSQFWKDLEPELERVLVGEYDFHEDYHFVRSQAHSEEDIYVSYSHTPIQEEDGRIVGTLDVMRESTVQMRQAKDRETQLQALQARQAFLLRLSDTLRSQDDPAEVQRLAARQLGEFIGVNRVIYSEIIGEDAVVHVQYVQGVAPQPARYPCKQLDQVLAATRERGGIVVVNDIETDPIFTETDRITLRAVQIAAFVGIMRTRNDRNVALFGAQSAAPRAWNPEEVALIRETAERTWDAFQRALAGEALRASEEKYRTLFTSMDEGYCIQKTVFDAAGLPDYLFLETNPAFVKQTGLANAVGKTLRELFPKADLAWIDRYSRIVGSGQPQRLTVFSHSLGNRWYDIFAFRIGGLEEDKVAVLFKDITERKRSENGLNRYNRLLTAINRILEFAVVTETEAGLSNVCLAASQDLSGAPMAFMGEVGSDGLLRDIAMSGTAWDQCQITDKSGHHRLPRDFAHGLFGRVLADGRSLIANDFSPDSLGLPGHPPLRSFLVTPVFKDGKVAGILAVANRDGGFGPEQQEDLEVLAAIVSQAFRRKRAEVAVREANEQLVEANRRKNHFLAVLSHELRNPLAPIKNSLFILDRSVPGSDQAQRSMDVIKRQVDQLARLVDDLLDVTRITRSRIQLQRRRLELNDLLRRTLEDYRSLLEKAGLEIRYQPSSRPLFVDADWNRISQAIGNLFQNAAKFTPPGGSVSIRLEADPEGRQAIVRVADTGAGIAPEMLSRLFEPFMQVDTTLDRNKGGLGLGLALVKGLVEQHGGTVKARSEGLGRGAEFIVSLPLDLSAGQGEAPHPAAAAKVARRILVIEDQADSADSLRSLLELEGHQVVVAYSGLDGLAAARTFHPDVVLCDIGLPCMDGYAVARALRADASLRQVRLVALTGYALPEDLQRAAEAGFDHHIAKPLSLDKLESAMR